jgi:hypothetical protein
MLSMLVPVSEVFAAKRGVRPTLYPAIESFEKISHVGQTKDNIMAIARQVLLDAEKDCKVYGREGGPLSKKEPQAAMEHASVLLGDIEDNGYEATEDDGMDTPFSPKTTTTGPTSIFDSDSQKLD